MADTPDSEKRAATFAEGIGLPKGLEGVKEIVEQGLKRRAALQAEAISLPKELHKVRDAARRAIHPLKPADASTQAEAKFLFTARGTDAGRNLPLYHLVYLLLVDLLGFRDLGRFEKLAWSIPIDLDGVVYLIEHRKFGVGVFARDAEDSEQQAQRIAALIKKGVRTASPFFKWTAEKAVRESKVNVSNLGSPLFERYVYFRDSFRTASIETEESKCAYNAKRKQRQLDIQLYSFKESKTASKTELIAAFTHPWMLLSRNASWLALAAVDAFFAWTEHIFIHLAILQGKVTTGLEVDKLAGVEWNEKFKCALDIGDSITKKYFDELITIRRQLRNFMAHGAFGKEREAFHFHSRAGAVPVALDRRPAQPHFSLTPELAFDDIKALATIDNFVAHLWSGARKPAQLYLQESNLPLILPMASNGTYRAAMTSIDDMRKFIDDLTRQSDDAAHMDW